MPAGSDCLTPSSCAAAAATTQGAVGCGHEGEAGVLDMGFLEGGFISLWV